WRRKYAIEEAQLSDSTAQAVSDGCTDAACGAGDQHTVDISHQGARGSGLAGRSGESREYGLRRRWDALTAMLK
ncbi:MAG: hypothetical protein ABI323_14400, partial [Solirubrobacteraceae bacterium]